MPAERDVVRRAAKDAPSNAVEVALAKLAKNISEPAQTTPRPSPKRSIVVAKLNVGRTRDTDWSNTGEKEFSSFQLSSVIRSVRADRIVCSSHFLF